MSCWRGIQTRFVSTLLFKHTSCKSRHVINCHPQQLRSFFLIWLRVHWWGNNQTLLHVESCGGSLLVWGSSPVAVMMMCVIIPHLPGEIILRPNKASDLLMQQNPGVCIYLCIGCWQSHFFIVQENQSQQNQWSAKVERSEETGCIGTVSINLL